MQSSLLAYTTSLHVIVERRIEEFIEQYRPRWVYVMLSGGKDSSAALAATSSCCKDMVVAVFNHIVGQTHSLNVQAALGVARELGLEVRRLAPRSPEDLRLRLLREPPRPGELLYLIVRSYRGGIDYWSAAVRWGFPAPAERWGRGLRWCCSEYKEKWWGELLSNGTYNGKPARFVVVGVKRSDSSYRSRNWKSNVRIFAKTLIDVAYAPLADLSEADVWALLKHYGLYNIVKKQYDVMGHSPNCTLCPLMGKKALKQTIENLPSNYLQHVLAVLREIQPRYKPSTFSYQRISEWTRMIEEELARREAESHG